MKLEQLAIDHDYYCSDSNYYANDAGQKFGTFEDFYDEYIDADIDYNLIFRWDIKKNEDSNKFFAEIFVMQQRKGKFVPIMIESIEQKDVEKFIEFVSMHWQKLVSIWNPISKLTEEEKKQILEP